MINILDNLLLKEKWFGFLSFLLEKRDYKEKEIDLVKDIIKNKKFLLFTNQYLFNLICETELAVIKVPKFDSGEKRTIFVATEMLDIILKFISYCLREYDFFFVDNVCSYRSFNGIKKAINKAVEFKHKYKSILKLDIHSYFLSMNKKILLNQISQLFKGDSSFVFFNSMLLNMKNSRGIESGGLPGLSISCFYANVYLSKLDFYLLYNKIDFLRYSDDLIIFYDEETQSDIVKNVFNIISELGLLINDKKTLKQSSNDDIEFLGFSLNKDNIDISQSSFAKIKRKMKRLSKKVKRQISQGKVSKEIGLKIFIERFNKKFFSSSSNELSWALWYFPVITTTKTLKKIDHYFQEEVRSIYTMKYCKLNKKKVPYHFLKGNGYRTLVYEYYSNLSIKKRLNLIH